MICNVKFGTYKFNVQGCVDLGETVAWLPRTFNGNAGDYHCMCSRATKTRHSTQFNAVERSQALISCVHCRGPLCSGSQRCCLPP